MDSTVEDIAHRLSLTIHQFHHHYIATGTESLKVSRFPAIQEATFPIDGVPNPPVFRQIRK